MKFDTFCHFLVRKNLQLWYLNCIVTVNENFKLKKKIKITSSDSKVLFDTYF
jgi:hypothetical protein